MCCWRARSSADLSCLLLDEPAAGLDLGARERLVSRLGVLAADPGEPADGAGHPPLRGDPAWVHPCRPGATGRAGGGRSAGGGHHLPLVSATLRRSTSRRRARRAVVESRRLVRAHGCEQGQRNALAKPCALGTTKAVQVRRALTRSALRVSPPSTIWKRPLIRVFHRSEGRSSGSVACDPVGSGSRTVDRRAGTECPAALRRTTEAADPSTISTMNSSCSSMPARRW